MAEWWSIEVHGQPSGLTAYDAAYVALAEERAVPLLTDDETIVKVAGEIARPLVPR